MIFHHIGVACKNINESISIYKRLGFSVGDVIIDDIQKVRICFVNKADHPLLELVEPLNDNSPVNNILSKVGNIQYHNCYKSYTYENDIVGLKKIGFMLISKPVSAIAFNNKRICFLYNVNIGLIELVEE